MYLAVDIDPTQYLAYGTNGLIALAVVVVLGSFVSVVGAILYAEQKRQKQDDAAAVQRSAEADRRDQRLIDLLERFAGLSEKVNTQLVALKGQMEDHEKADDDRFNRLERAIGSGQHDKAS